MFMKKQILLSGFVLILFSVSAQLIKPQVSSSDPGWGWFNLQINNLTITPDNTQWEIIWGEYNETVLQTYCNPNSNTECESFCQGSFTADKRDLISKEILGCKSNANYIVRARYNKDSEWSDWSDVLEVNTPGKPFFTGDTVNIILWGHSFVRFGDQCDGVTNIRLGEEAWDYDDNFAHILQTELIKLTGLNIKVINEGVNGSRQSEWITEHSYKYKDGGIYNNTGKYSIAAFFFGANDAANNYPVDNYGADINTIVDFLTAKNVKIVYSSIHHTISEMMAGNSTQLDYLDEWNKVMNEMSANSKLWKGLDLYNLFKSDSVKFLGADGIHPDLSEGIVTVVHLLAPYFIAAIYNTAVSANAYILENNNFSFSMIDKDKLLINNKTNLNSVLKLYDIAGNLKFSFRSNGKSEALVKLPQLNKGLYIGILQDLQGKTIFVKKLSLVY